MRLTDGGRPARAGRPFSHWEADSDRLWGFGGASTPMGSNIPRAARTIDSIDLVGAEIIAEDRLRGPMTAPLGAARFPEAAYDR